MKRLRELARSIHGNHHRVDLRIVQDLTEVGRASHLGQRAPEALEHVWIYVTDRAERAPVELPEHPDEVLAPATGTDDSDFQHAQR